MSRSDRMVKLARDYRLALGRHDALSVAVAAAELLPLLREFGLTTRSLALLVDGRLYWADESAGQIATEALTC